MEGLSSCEGNMVVYLHPSKAKCAHEAMLGELSSLLFTYNETFEGVVLAYDLISFDKVGKILPGLQPYFGIKVKANLLLFSPKPGMVLEGEVVKITPHSIHTVVLGFSSAYIADEEIRDEFKYKNKHGKEMYVSRTHKNHKIKVGTVLRFVVKSFDEEILHVSGSLAAESTGCAKWLCQNPDKWSNVDSTTTTMKNEIGGEEDKKPDNDRSVSQKTVEQVNISKKRKKEHRFSLEH